MIIEDHLVSIIIPIYGVEIYLKKCIESVLNQSYSNLQIILVNDGSKDNCAEICEHYSKLDSRIIITKMQIANDCIFISFREKKLINRKIPIGLKPSSMIL